MTDCDVTHCCITLHVHAYPFDFLLFDTGKDGRVGSFTEKQCITWNTDSMSAESQHQCELKKPQQSRRRSQSHLI